MGYVRRVKMPGADGGGLIALVMPDGFKSAPEMIPIMIRR